MTFEDLRREIERRLQQYKKMPTGAPGAKWLDDAISIVNDVFDPYCPAEGDEDESNSAQPKRIQRKRTKGWQMPENAVYVGRPSKWGNPVKSPWPTPNNAQRVLIIAEFEKHFRQWLDNEPSARQTLIDELRGKDLACWCRIDQPCHADVLLRLANA